MSNSVKKRVNLGSGNDYLEGWINVDIDQNTKVDVMADLSKNFPFADLTIDEIKASDILEHFTKEDGLIFLKECYRVLINNGKIFIRTHDLYEIYKKFSNDPLVMTHFIYGDTSETGIFGTHKYAYSRESLKLILNKIGFEIESYKLNQTNHEVVAIKKKFKRRPLVIGIIQQTPDLGGAESYMNSLVLKWLKLGTTVYLATNLKRYAKLYPKEVSIDLVPYIIDINGNWKGLVKSFILLPLITIYYARLLRKYKAKKVDVLLASNFSDKLLVTFLSVFYRIPIVWIEYGRLHTVFKRNFYFPKVIYRLFKNIPKKVIVPSRNTHESLIIDARVSLSKLVLIPCGVEIPSQKKSKINLSKKISGKYVIGNISRMTKEKGQEVIIKSAPHILKIIPNAVFILVGDGPDRSYFESLIKKANLENYFILPGFAEDVKDYYSLMDVFVFPTIWEMEGFGLVSIESMMHAVPVVASNIRPVSEIIDDYQTGILFNPGNPQDLSKKVIELYLNHTLRKKVIKLARKKAHEKYNIESISHEIYEILNDATLQK
jgi:glycosyltransferase involved in cell wall biosynthesis/predicted SAM-dependent methyltransferase